MRNFSFFSSGPNEKNKILKAFESFKINNRNIEVSITEKFDFKKAKKSKSQKKEKKLSKKIKINPFKYATNSRKK